jgi:hypothetical protein
MDGVWLMWLHIIMRERERERNRDHELWIF